MKRVLILAEQYYPLQVPSTFRVHSFAKFLPEFGYDCHVISPSWHADNLADVSHGRQVFAGSESQSPCPLTLVPVHPVFTAGRLECYFWPCREGSRIADEMVLAAKELWNKNSFDAIIATIPAYYPLRAANALAKEFSVPVVADFRDIYAEHDGPAQRTWHEKVMRRMKILLGKHWLVWRELESLCRNTITTTVSAPLALALERHGIKGTEVIFNGFDPEDFEQVAKTRQEKFRITYAGTVHGFQDPSRFFDAIDILLEKELIELSDFEVAFYSGAGALDSHLANRRCRQVVQQHAMVSKKLISSVMVNSSILLHLSVETLTGGIMTSKITEYLGAGSPILSVTGDNDVVDKFLATTKSGVSLESTDSIVGFILKNYQLWQATGETEYDVDPLAVEQYTRRFQCRKMAKILDANS